MITRLPLYSGGRVCCLSIWSFPWPFFRAASRQVAQQIIKRGKAVYAFRGSMDGFPSVELKEKGVIYGGFFFLLQCWY